MAAILNFTCPFISYGNCFQLIYNIIIEVEVHKNINSHFPYFTCNTYLSIGRDKERGATSLLDYHFLKRYKERKNDDLHDKSEEA